MPDINQINGLVLCDETNVNGVTITNISNIDDIAKNCCTANGPISLAVDGDSCPNACASEECANYYSDGNVDACPLVNGDHLWADNNCNCADVGFYSPQNCEGGCAYCYTVDESCVITVTECPGESCNAIDLSSAGSRARCSTACDGEECTTYYVNQEIACPLSVGTEIYTDGECSECAAPGFYSPKPCEGEEACTYCYTLGSEEGCQITAVAACGR